MPQQSFADYDSQYLSIRHKGLSFLPTPRPNARYAQRQVESTQPVKPSPLHYETGKSHHRHESSSSSSGGATSAATSRSSTASSMSSHTAHGPFSARDASLKARDIRPTSDVAEWAHQAHITQGRSYWWCQGCFPRAVSEPLEIPKAVEKVMTGRRVRINEPTHCYDI